jgi:hypothetical protein
MTFDVFLQALIKISELKYANTTSPSLALQSLIVNYLLPLHSMIYTKAHNKYGIEGGILNLQFDELVSLVFRDVGLTLLEVYKVYF